MNICPLSKPAYISNYLNKKEGLLVGGFNPIEKMGSSSPIFGVKIRNYLSCHQPDCCC